MCGLAFASRNTPQARAVMKLLVYEMVDRGMDSFGFTTGLHTWKTDKDGLECWAEVEKMLALLPENVGVICHTRAASVGDVSPTNAHPFEVRSIARPGVVVVGAHNGGVPNWKELNEKYGRGYAVDSQHIFGHIAEGLDTSELAGYGAAVWFERTESGEIDQGSERSVIVKDLTLRFAKWNGGTLEVTQTPAGVFGCSTQAPLRKAIRMVGLDLCAVELKIEAEMRYKVGRDDEWEGDPEGDVVWQDGKMVFGFRQSPGRGFNVGRLDQEGGWAGWYEFGHEHKGYVAKGQDGIEFKAEGETRWVLAFDKDMDTLRIGTYCKLYKCGKGYQNMVNSGGLKYILLNSPEFKVLWEARFGQAQEIKKKETLAEPLEKVLGGGKESSSTMLLPGDQKPPGYVEPLALTGHVDKVTTAIGVFKVYKNSGASGSPNMWTNPTQMLVLGQQEFVKEQQEAIEKCRCLKCRGELVGPGSQWSATRKMMYVELPYRIFKELGMYLDGVNLSKVGGWKDSPQRAEWEWVPWEGYGENKGSTFQEMGFEVARGYFMNLGVCVECLVKTMGQVNDSFRVYACHVLGKGVAEWLKKRYKEKGLGEVVQGTGGGPGLQRMASRLDG